MSALWNTRVTGMWFSKFGGLALICVLALSGPSMAQARALPPYQYFD